MRAAPARPDAATPPLLPPPAAPTRSFTTTRRVRLADVRPSGRTRLDAIARYLQDVAVDDVRDAGAADDYRWVVRRTRLEVSHRPLYEEPIEVTTWCSGTGPAWAERRTSVRAHRGLLVDAVSLWVSLDPGTLRPTPLGERFAQVYGPAAAGRSVRARLLHGPPPPGATSQAWPLRDSDFDLLDHVTNAVAWEVLDQAVARQAAGRRVTAGEVEYRAPIESVESVEVLSIVADDALRLWVLDPAGQVTVSAVADLEARPR